MNFWSELSAFLGSGSIGSEVPDCASRKGSYCEGKGNTWCFKRTRNDQKDSEGPKIEITERSHAKGTPCHGLWRTLPQVLWKSGRFGWLKYIYEAISRGGF